MNTGSKFVGTDGANGSDANVTFDNIKAALQKASGISGAYLTMDEIGAPEIYGGKIYGVEIYAGGINEKGGQVIGLTDGGINIFDGQHDERVLTISGNSNGASLTTGYQWFKISSPYITLSGTNNIRFESMCVDFTGVDEIKGVCATFV